MSQETTAAYEDGAILCDDQGLTIRRYYPWGVGHRVRPTITPDDPDAVERILAAA